MGKFFKKLFLLGFLSLLGYGVIWFYSKIKAAIDLNNSLPQYLKNVYEETFETEIKIAFRNYTIVVQCNEGMLEKSDIVEQSVHDYIQDFYPELSNYLSISIECNENH